MKSYEAIIRQAMNKKLYQRFIHNADPSAHINPEPRTVASNLIATSIRIVANEHAD
jgi:hypothetical protein